MYPGLPEYISERCGMYPVDRFGKLAFADAAKRGVRRAGDLGDWCWRRNWLVQFNDQDRAAVRTQFAGRELEVVYHNPRRLEYGAYAVRRVAVGNVELPVTHEAKGVRIGREVITGLNTMIKQRLDVELG